MAPGQGRKPGMKRPLILQFLMALAPALLCAATIPVNVGPGTSFSPASISINTGDTVVWQFVGPNHTTTSDATIGPETWNSNVVPVGGSFSHTFGTAGTFPYYCAIHSFAGGTMMNGQVMVSAPPPPLTPAVSTVLPSSGPTAGGTAVALTGSNFLPGCTVSFGGVAAAVSFISASSLQATTPAHAAGPVSLLVNCSNGSVTLPGGFVYLAPSAPVPAVSGPALIALLVMLAIAGFTALRR